ncbi:MAG: hypothetical protein OXF06_02105 [Bacteroidetes bacterium]|nr:hypothetical protein [Bacteroidota bacterium]
MRYDSIDALQKVLADSVFSYARAPKKASGRALGTLVEVVTYYALRTWGLSDNTVIERHVSEFANPTIEHNVEFSLHAVHARNQIDISPLSPPITGIKIQRSLPALRDSPVKQVQLLTTKDVKRNAAVLVNEESHLVVANLENFSNSVVVCQLNVQPFAIVECKRVGIEEGMRKGPQTIEKAKQGAYVARSVSSLQKIRLRSGEIHGLIENKDGNLRTGPYDTLLNQLIQEEDILQDFIVTVGVVSNHGNWFTADSQNKELRILSQSYDWLLFLTDEGICRFVNDLLLAPSPKLQPVNEAFSKSYTGERGVNRFTKVLMDIHADQILQDWFSEHRNDVENWFNVISPNGGTLFKLQDDLIHLSSKRRSHEVGHVK